MKKLAIALLIVSVVGTAYTCGDAEIVIQLANKDTDIFQASGMYKAAEAISRSSGPLKKYASYDFSGDFKGSMLDHPVQDNPQDQGTWELQDAKGRFIIQHFMMIAK